MVNKQVPDSNLNVTLKPEKGVALLKVVSACLDVFVCIRERLFRTFRVWLLKHDTFIMFYWTRVCSGSNDVGKQPRYFSFGSSFIYLTNWLTLQKNTKQVTNLFWNLKNIAFNKLLTGPVEKLVWQSSKTS